MTKFDNEIPNSCYESVHVGKIFLSAVKSPLEALSKHKSPSRKPGDSKCMVWAKLTTPY